MKLALLCMTALVLLLPKSPALAAGAGRTGPADVLRVMERVADWQFAHPGRHSPTDWTEGTLDAGLVALYSVSREQAYLDALLRMGDENHWQPGPRPYNADDQAVCQTYCDLYLWKHDPQMIAPTRARFDFVLENPKRGPLRFGPRSQGRWSWADALFMAPPAWARLYAATGDRRYLDFLDAEWWDTVGALYDPAEGLFYRDTRFFDKPCPNGKKDFWSRGNGWAYGGLVRVLEFLPTDHPSRPKYLKLYQDMSAAIVAAQQEDGLWRPSLLDPDQVPKGETSGSGLFCYGLAWGVGHGLLDTAKYGPAVTRAWAALAGRVHPDGMIGDVQPIASAPGGFTDDSTEVYGTGAFLLAGSEVYRTLEGTSSNRSMNTSSTPGGLPAGDTLADLARLRNQMREYLLQPIPKTTADVFTSPSGQEVQQWTASLRPDGTWQDIAYDDKTPNFWKTASHLNRTVAMAKRYDGAIRAGKSDPALRRAVLLALDHWLAKDYQNPNWWQNLIGVPSAIGDILLLMQDDLSPGELKQGTEIMARAQIERTGQNMVWEAGIVLLRAALLDDVVTARQARNAIVGEMVVTTDEGVQPDFSFHQHGPDLQVGNYGLAYAGSFAQWAQVLRGTSFAIDDARLSILRNYLLQGAAPFLWGDALDISACGRQLFPESPAKKSEAYNTILAGMARTDTAHADQYQRGGAVLPFNKHFWRSDIMVHRRPDYYTSVKMSSRRVIGAECVNAENLSGYYLADGAMYVRRTGKEYEDVFPVWDWRRLPGVTCPQAIGPLPKLGIDNYRPPSNFVGGVSDGTYGAAALDLDRDGLTGRKSWFFFDHEVVCLGAGLHMDNEQDVVTSINQCLLKGDVTVGDGDTETTLPMGRRTRPRVRWVHHDGVGYVFTEPMTVTVGGQAQSGLWQSVYSAGPAGTVTRDVFSLWIDHGARPQAAHYAYVVLPNASTGQVQAYAAAPEVEVLRNTAGLQAVHSNTLGITFAVFYRPGGLDYAANKRVTVDAPCLLMLKQTNTGTRIAVADPTQELPSLQVTLDGLARRIILPQGPDAGRSAALSP